MARINYQDLNFMGKSTDRIRPKKKISLKTHSSVFFFTMIILTVLGLISVYSSSYPLAIEQGYRQYYYLIRQILNIALGLFVFFVIKYIPEQLLKLSCPVLMIGASAVMIINLITKNTVLGSFDYSIWVFIITVMYLSLFFSNRPNGITRLRELFFPIIFSVLMVMMLLIQKNMTNMFLYLFLVVLMFSVGGVSAAGVFMLILYAAVPSVCWILTDSYKVNHLLEILIPGLSEKTNAVQILYRYQSIASGGLFGKGLGHGQFKNTIENISDRFIFCNICEEAGFLGVIFVIAVFVVFVFSAYNAAQKIRKENKFISNMAIGFSTVIFFQFVLNIVEIFGFLPVQGINMPFFSYGTNIIATMAECALISRSMVSVIPASHDEIADNDNDVSLRQVNNNEFEF